MMKLSKAFKVEEPHTDNIGLQQSCHHIKDIDNSVPTTIAPTKQD